MTPFIHSTMFAATIMFAATTLNLSPAVAAGEHDDDHGTVGTVGTPGAVADVTRTITITMGDNFFEPENLAFSPGETIRFVVKNGGEFVHEFNIGTADMHREHQKEMMMMVDMDVLLPDRIDMKAAAKMQKAMGHGMHKDLNSVLLEPGQSGQIIWTFPEADDVVIEFGCNVPGHYDAGMVGEFDLSK